MSDTEKRRQLELNLNLISADHTFDNFMLLPGTEETLRAFRKVATGQVGIYMLLCFGGVGNGKTYLCEAAAIELYKRGLFTRVMTMGRILQSLKDFMGKGDNSYNDLLKRYCLAERLIIDDIGAGVHGEDYMFSVLEEIVVNRYGRKLLTICTTNLDIEKFPDRVISRFQDRINGYCVQNKGKDYREQLR